MQPAEKFLFGPVKLSMPMYILIWIHKTLSRD